MVEIVITFITAFVIGVLMNGAFHENQPKSILLLIFIVGVLTGIGLYVVVMYIGVMIGN